MDGRLQKVFVGYPIKKGQPGAKEPMEREWETGMFKEEIAGPVWVGATNIKGDGQADLKHHGGPEKAIFAYSTEHYSYWESNIEGSAISPGGMGENFLIDHLNEDHVCIGDTYEVGEATIQVSQPRQPCWKPARRFKIKNLALLIQNTGRTGWYFRVLKEGMVEKGQTLHLVERQFPQWTISKCNEIMHQDKKNMQLARELAACSLLAPGWRKTLSDRVENGIEGDIQERIIGPNQ